MRCGRRRAPQGLDFYFRSKQHGAGFVAFLQGVVPVRIKTAEQLISVDTKSNVAIVAALIAGSLASRIREQAQAARQRAADMQALYDFSRKLAGTAKPEEVLWASVT